MKALDPKRLRVVLYYVVALLFVAATFVEKHMKAHTRVVLPTGLLAALFMFVALRGRYNLAD